MGPELLQIMADGSWNISHDYTKFVIPQWSNKFQYGKAEAINPKIFEFCYLNITQTLYDFKGSVEIMTF